MSMDQRRNNLSHKLSQWIERVLLTAGIVLLAVWGAARLEGIIASRRAIERFETIDSPAPLSIGQMQDETSSNPSGINFSLWGKSRLRAYQRSLAHTSSTPLAILRIPAIHLEVSVLDGTDRLTLNHAVGRIAGTARFDEPGNVGIAGHRDGFFRGLKDVVVGDRIEVESGKGTTLYVVDRVGVVAPLDVSVLETSSGPSLTLVTCYPFYFIGPAPQRYIVSASQIRDRQRSNTKLDYRQPQPIS